MARGSAWLARAQATSTVAGREVQALVRGLAGYGALATALLAAGWFLSTDLARVRTNGLLVQDSPFQAPLLAAALVLSIFLALSAVVSVARERERGTLEVLFYGPIDEPSYIVGKFLGQVGGYLLALPILLVSFVLLSLLSGFLLSPLLVLGLLASLVPAAEVVAFGLLLSVLAGRLRTALLLFVSVIALFLAVTVAHDFLSTWPIDNPASPILPVREALGALDAVVQWLSPFAYLERILENIALGAGPPTAVALLAGLAHLGLGLGLASLALRRRGVRPKGD
jgi:ABC-type transport system involved in multi-copper enzyme maturation permease subunit